MRKVHESLKTTGVHPMKPVESIVISDPLYDSDIELRYENNDVSFNYMELLKRSDKYVENERQYDSEYVLVLLFKTQDSSKIKNMKRSDYSIGVDSASYEICMNENGKTIQTACDGIWGDVSEFYDKKSLEVLKIILPVPDMAMTANDFYNSIAKVVGVNPPLQTLYDRACNINCDEIEDCSISPEM